MCTACYAISLRSVAENLPRDEAEKIKQELEAAGCTVELKQ